MVVRGETVEGEVVMHYDLDDHSPIRAGLGMDRCQVSNCARPNFDRSSAGGVSAWGVGYSSLATEPRRDRPVVPEMNTSLNLVICLGQMLPLTANHVAHRGMMDR